MEKKKIECDEYINNMVSCFNEYKSFKRDNVEECFIENLLPPLPPPPPSPLRRQSGYYY